MEKPADNQHPLHDLIRRRWSPRAFADKSVPKDVLASVLEAARWTASCFNDQPWRYLVSRREDPEEFNRMVSCLAPKNQRWASHAPILMISVASKLFAYNQLPNRTAQHDLGAASAELTLQALSIGLFVHQMAGIDQGKIRTTYEIPDAFEPVAALALGYPGELSTLPEEFHAAETEKRTRHPLSSFTFEKRWGNPVSF